MQNRTEQPHPHLAGLPVFLRAPRATGLWLIGVLITLATIVAFGLSYRGLFLWAAHHQWPPPWPAFFPLLIDVLIVVCEVILFVAAIDGDTPWRVRVLAWWTLLAFTCLSVAGNAEHAARAGWQARIGFALPPLVLAVALAFGLGELKRQAGKYREDDERGRGAVDSSVPRGSPAASPRASLPTVRGIQDRQKCSPTTAKKIRAEVAADRRSRGGPAERVPAVPAVTGVPAGENPRSLAGASPNGQAHG